MTNADRIRNMCNEELAHVLRCLPEQLPPDGENCNTYNCYLCTINWLKQEISAPPQKAPLCLSCKHGENGCVDDFATCYCPHHGCVGQKTECGEYEAKEVLDNG